MWAGGVVGLKSILGIKKRSKALAMMDELVRLGLVAYTLDSKTKKLELTIPDWVHNCDGSECTSGVLTRSPMVRIFARSSFSAVDEPTENSSRTGSGHIFAGISWR